MEGKNKPVSIERRREQGTERDRGAIRERLKALRESDRQELTPSLSWFSEVSLVLDKSIGIFTVIHSFLGWPE